ncbi:MAG TPA: phosphomannomutase/phosphoglucomutase [Candidatus Portnoybacteria bacterium]|nr:phosphomannomutase/phosphoglucomutase [Candidatus Portnoybacteria bacterium]
MMSIFKAYDIRGIYPDELNEEIAQKIGRAIVLFFKQKKWPLEKIIIGRDARISSPKLFQTLIQGLLLENPILKIINFEQCSTPFFYWAIQKYQADGGIMITASHNPPEYNGLKLCRREAIPLGGEEIKNIGKIVSEINFSNNLDVSAEISNVKPVEVELEQEYFSFLLNKINLSKIKPLKIIIDCGNGMIGPEMEEIVKKIPIQTKILYSQPDGTFPHHLANPLDEKTLIDLKKQIEKENADFGVAFDGDGDRIGLIDEKSQPVRGDFILSLLAIKYLKKYPNEKIIYEVRSSKIVPEMIKENNGQAILSRAGHSFIKKKMREEDAILAGELSGHYFYRELGFTDNALFTFLNLLEIFSQDNKPISQVIQPFQKYSQSGEINFRVNNKQKILQQIEEKYFDGKIIKVDGLTVIYPDWWFNLRPSNTENLLRLNLEANNVILMKEKVAEIEKIVE